jgi:hypothetical protein
MSIVKFTIQDKLTSSVSRIQRQLDRVPREAFQFFVKETPIRTGNARRNTYLKQAVIYASYPYARRLNTGWSRQSPEGMTNPTRKFIKQRVALILKGK